MRLSSSFSFCPSASEENCPGLHPWWVGPFGAQPELLKQLESAEDGGRGQQKASSPGERHTHRFASQS